MKKLFYFILTCFLFQSSTLAAMPVLQASQKPYAYYLNYYIVDKKNINMTFIPINKELRKNLNNIEKSRYKKIVKLEKLLQSGQIRNINKAIAKDREFLPSYVAYYQYAKKNKLYKDGAIALDNILYFNKQYNIFDVDELNFQAGMFFYGAGYNQEALKYLTPYIKENLKNDAFIFIISDLNFKNKKYKDTIFYANKLINNTEYKEEVLTLLFDSYEGLKDKMNASKYARLLIKIKPNSLNYLRLIMNSNNKSEILTYAYKVAENYAKENDFKNALEFCSVDIIRLEEEKIQNAVKNVKGFIEIPSWKTIFENDYAYMRYDTAYNRLINFYKSTDTCIKKYYGNDLKACFANVNKNQEKITTKLVNEKRAEEARIAEEIKIRQLQLMNYNMMQQNNLIQEQNYQLSRPRYTNYTTTQYGNTFYTNSYSY